MGGLGEVLGTDRRNQGSMDQRFCFGLLSDSEWKTHVVVKNASTGKQEVILLDYYNLPIRCQFCLATDHMVKDCAGIPNRLKDVVAGKEQSPSIASGTTRTVQPHRTTPVSD